MKDKFLAVMSHELEQPLNLIQVAQNGSHVCRDAGVSAAPRIGATIQRALGSQTKFINDLLDLSRARTGKLRLHLVEVDLGELVRQLALAAVGDLEQETIALEVGGHPSLGYVCDRVRVKQIVWNLLSNAIEFTP